ncbi:hypothetical protein [Priestia megaterium]|uniref:hypothetical protein n=1 Tax=Priestia megaterium TaxID=1404 RepID=UPI003459022B
MSKFQNYIHFKNYCFKIIRNKDIKITSEVNQAFSEFEKVEHVLNVLKKNGVIDYEKCVLECLVKVLQENTLGDALNSMKYLVKKVTEMLNGDSNIYYLHTSLKTMIGMDTQFPEKYVVKGFATRKETQLYPMRIKCVEVLNESEKIYSISPFDLDLLENHGVYFIYDDDGKIAYIGKSNSCVVSRCFKSVEERGLYSFSKIEIRCTPTMSDANIYEPYYIAKYKPYLNSEFMHNDETTIILPTLEATKTFNKESSGDYFEFTYSFLRSKTYDTEEAIKRLGNNLFLDSEETKELLKRKGLLEKWEARNKAYKECLQTIRSSGFITIRDLQEEIRLMLRNKEI